MSSDKKPNKNPPRYAAAVEEAWRKNPSRPGSINRVEVRHDTWCEQFNHRGPCNCNFEVVWCGEIQ